MTKPLVIVALLAVALLPAAAAHGAEPSREIDTRVMADDDGPTGYGVCLEGSCAPGTSPEGWDLLVLEAREAALPDGSPVLILRTIYQAAEEHEGRAVTIKLTAGGKEHTYDFTVAGAVASSTTFDLVEGPFDAFDGFPKAVDGYVRLDAIGAKPGDEVTAISVTSTVGGEASDVMPGTWFLDGQEVPSVPAGLEEHDAEGGHYALRGPATLLSAEASAPTGNATRFTVTVKNPLSTMAQFANLTVQASGGAKATLDSSSLKLEPGESRTVQVNVQPGAQAANVTVTATSDLAAYTTVSAQVPARVIPIVTTTSPSTSSLTSQEQTEEAPGLAGALSLVVVALVALARRRLHE